jgi:hypothetical protein
MANPLLGEELLPARLERARVEDWIRNLRTPAAELSSSLGHREPLRRLSLSGSSIPVTQSLRLA